MCGAALFLPAVFFAMSPEDFPAFAALEIILLITNPDLAAGALATAGALAPYKAAELTRPVYAYLGRITRFRASSVMIALPGTATGSILPVLPSTA